MTGAQFHAWAEGCGADPYHTTHWTPVQRASFMAFKLQKARDGFRWLARFRPRAYMDRQMLIDNIRQDVREALRPPPSETYRGPCPCHPRHYHNAAPEPPPPTPEAARTYLATFAPRSKGSPG